MIPGVFAADLKNQPTPQFCGCFEDLGHSNLLAGIVLPTTSGLVKRSQPLYQLLFHPLGASLLVLTYDGISS